VAKQKAKWRKWLIYKGFSEVASMLGISRQAVFLWAERDQMPKDAHKRKLVELADGEFDLMDFYQ
jgi:hypothetical protein